MSREFLFQTIEDVLRETKGNRLEAEPQIAGGFFDFIEVDPVSRNITNRMREKGFSDPAILRTFVDYVMQSKGLGEVPVWETELPTSDGNVVREIDSNQTAFRRSLFARELERQRSAFQMLDSTKWIAPMLDKYENLQGAYQNLIGRNYKELKTAIDEDRDFAAQDASPLELLGVFEFPTKIAMSFMHTPTRGYAVERPRPEAVSQEELDSHVSAVSRFTGSSKDNPKIRESIKRQLIAQKERAGQIPPKEYVYTQNPFVALEVSGRFQDQGRDAKLDDLSGQIASFGDVKQSDPSSEIFSMDLGGGIYRTTSSKSFSETMKGLGEQVATFGISANVPNIATQARNEGFSEGEALTLGIGGDLLITGGAGLATKAPKALMPSLAKRLGEPVAGSVASKANRVFTSAAPEITEAVRASKSVAREAIDDVSTMELVKQTMARGVAKFLPRGQFGELREKIIAWQSGAPTAAALTHGNMRRAIKGLSPDDLDLFEWNVILDDLSENVTKGLPQVPFYGSKFDLLKADIDSLNELVKQRPAVQNAVKTYRSDFNAVRDAYIAGPGKYIDGLEDRLTTYENYFPHQVIEYMDAQRAFGVQGARLRGQSTRGFMKGREGTSLPINTNVIEATSSVQYQMMRDIQASEILDAAKPFDISAKVKASGGKIPDGFVEFYPGNPRHFFLAQSVPDRIAREISEKGLVATGISEDVLKQILAVGSAKAPWILPKNVAQQLEDSLSIPGTLLSKPFLEKMTSGWKAWTLTAPHRVASYNFRNAISDFGNLIAADPAFFLKPSGWKYMKDALVDMAPIVTRRFEKLSGDSLEYARRGGMFQSSRFAELGDIKNLTDYGYAYGKATSEADIKLFEPAMRVLRDSTEYREAIFRYALYKKSLDDIRKNGKPSFFGASDRSEVLLLNNPFDQAFKIANDTLGRFNDVSPLTQSARKNLIPFASWKEVNLKIQKGLIQNAKIDYETARSILNKSGGMALPELVKIPLAYSAAVTGSAIKAATMLVRANLVYGSMMAYNNLVFPEAEKKLGDDRWAPHLTLGQNEKGEVFTAPAPQAFFEILEMMGARTAPGFLDSWVNGKTTTPELLKEFLVKEPINWIAQGVNPFVKTGVEELFGEALYPDVFDTRKLKTDFTSRAQRAFSIYTSAPAYRTLMGVPDEGVIANIRSSFVRKYDPAMGDFFDARKIVKQFRDSIGKPEPDFSGTPKGEALYRLGQAIRFERDDIAMDHLREFILLGGNPNDLKSKQYLKSGIPGGNLSEKDLKSFLASLTAREREIWRNGTKWYFETVINRQSKIEALLSKMKERKR